MRVAVASGKGGTGKTTIAVNLALALSTEARVQLLDCDVEEPNAHIFLDPQIESTRSVDKLLPRIDEARCTRCGACVEACEFHALARFGETMLVYDALCHGCGRCGLVCPADAISEVPHQLGVIETGTARGFPFAHGRLNVGEAMATPIIHALKDEILDARWTILDAPPGTGCPTIGTLHDVDAALLVTEPTPFGLHDLRAAVSVARTLELPIGVVINRDGIGDGAVDAFCRSEGLPVLLRIPFDRAIAAAYAHGATVIETMPTWRGRFLELAERLEEVAR